MRLPLAVSHRDYYSCLLRALDAVGFEESAAKRTELERETVRASRRRRRARFRANCDYCCSFSQTWRAVQYGSVCVYSEREKENVTLLLSELAARSAQQATRVA